MKVTFLKPAEVELDDAFLYYQSVYDGLGHQFIAEVSNSINRIVRFPASYQVIGKSSRRCLVNNFPYGVIFQERQNQIIIVAIAHLHRKPDYWNSRET